MGIIEVKICTLSGALFNPWVYHSARGWFRFLSLLEHKVLYFVPGALNFENCLTFANNFDLE